MDGVWKRESVAATLLLNVDTFGVRGLYGHTAG